MVKDSLPADEAEHNREADQFVGATPVAATDDELSDDDTDTVPAEHNGVAEAPPEPTELSDGSTVQVHQDTEHVGFSEDHKSHPGTVTSVDHSVSVTDLNGNRQTVETDSAEASAFLHWAVIALDKLGFRRG